MAQASTRVSSNPAIAAFAGGFRWWGGMAQALNKLTTRKVQSIAEPGRHADGGGLYLVVGKDGAKRWVMLYRLPGRRREMGLGPLISVTLARARELAAEARAKIANGIDPLEEKHAAARFVAPVTPVTFSDIAVAFMDDRERTWRNAKHRAQWRQTLEVQAAALWSMPVADIDTEHVLGVLRPIWQAKPETAQRIRGRVEAILDAARAAGKRGPENAARWRGHLDKLLPRARKLTRGHHAAMPYSEVPAFYRSLAERVSHGGSSGPGMRLLILTAARSGEVRGMTWGEVDMAGAVWVIPAERMKAGREHRVPLSAAAVRVLAGMRKPGAKPTTLVFPSSKGTSMSDMAFGMLLRKMSQPDVTTHGFRSSFRDWVGEETEFAGELAEAALAHLVGDAVERAYRRGDALEKRRHLMDAWAAFVAGESAAPSSTRISSS